jgi:ribose transport system permease protein
MANTRKGDLGFSAVSSLARSPYIVPLLLIVAMFGIGQILVGGFASVRNISNILTISSIVAVLAFAQTFVILSGGDGIDLSVGSVMSMAALLTPIICHDNLAMLPAAILITILLGALVGLINATGVLRLGIPPLIMTLIMSSVVDGFTLAYTQSLPPGRIADILLQLGRPAFWQIRWLLIVVVVILVLAELLIQRTVFGRSLFLTGSNRAAARLSGININKTVFLAYILGSALAAAGGTLLVGYAGSAQLKMANGYTLFSVAAAVIGGTKLSGGEGSMLGGFLGAIIFTLLTNVLIAVGLPAGVRILIQGLTLLVILGIYTRGPKLRQ